MWRPAGNGPGHERTAFRRRPPWWACCVTRPYAKPLRPTHPDLVGQGRCTASPKRWPLAPGGRAEPGRTERRSGRSCHVLSTRRPECLDVPSRLRPRRPRKAPSRAAAVPQPRASGWRTRSSRPFRRHALGRYQIPPAALTMLKSTLSSATCRWSDSSATPHAALVGAAGSKASPLRDIYPLDTRPPGLSEPFYMAQPAPLRFRPFGPQTDWSGTVVSIPAVAQQFEGPRKGVSLVDDKLKRA